MDSDKKEFKCRNCGNTVGLTNGKYFWVGECKFYRVVSFYCLKCGHENRWRPFPQRKTMVK